MSATALAPRSRLYLRWLAVAAGVALLFVATVATFSWRSRDRFADEVRRIGGRYREEVVDSRMAAFAKAIHGKPLTVFHWIDLEHSQADDAWLAAHRDDIARQTTLILFMKNTPISSTGLAALKGLDNISLLELSGAPVGDAAVETIASLPNVVQASIDGTGISDVALAKLATAPHLGFLTIDHTQSTEAGIDGLAMCPVLHGLWIQDADNGSVMRVSKLPRLKHLYLHGRNVTAESLPALRQMPLEVLQFYDTSLSDAEIAELKRALPNCTIQQMEYSKLEAIRAASWE